MVIHYQSKRLYGFQDFVEIGYFRSINHDEHYIAWIKHLRERRFWNVWYRGKVSRMTQLKQLKGKPEYDWLKNIWKRELDDRRRIKL